MTRPHVYADFHNADAHGRLSLNCRRTLDDLNRQQVILSEGLQLTLYSDDLETEGEVQFSAEEQLWTAVIDWDAIRRFDDVELPAGIDDQEI